MEHDNYKRLVYLKNEFDSPVTPIELNNNHKTIVVTMLNLQFLK